MEQDKQPKNLEDFSEADYSEEDPGSPQRSDTYFASFATAEDVHAVLRIDFKTDNDTGSQETEPNGTMITRSYYARDVNKLIFNRPLAFDTVNEVLKRHGKFGPQHITVYDPCRYLEDQVNEWRSERKTEQ